MRKDPEYIIFVTLIVLSVVGGGMRFVNLDRKQFWYDESYTALIVSGHYSRQLSDDISHRILPLSELTKYRSVGEQSTVNNTLGAMIEDEPGKSPIFYFLEQIFCKLFGSSPFVMRLASVIISLLSLPVIFWLARETYGSRILAALTMTFAAISPALIYFAQEARDYTIGLFWMFLSSALLLYSLRTSKRAGWICYSAALVLGLYSWLITLCAAAGQALYVFASKERRKKSWLPFLLTLIVAGAFFSPWLLVVEQHTLGLKNAYNWMEPPVPANALFNVWLTTPCKAFALFGLQSGSFESLLLVVTVLEAAAMAIALRFVRGATYLQLSIIFVWFLVFGGQDILLGGARSAPFRYQMMAISCTLILFTTLIEWLWTLKFSIMRVVAAAISVFIIGLEISSSVYMLQEKTWPNKSMAMRYTYPIAERLTKEKEPVIVCEQRRINLGEVLDLATVLNGDTKLIWLTNENPQSIPTTMSRLYLWNPSPQLEKQLSEAGYTLSDKVDEIPYLKMAVRN